MKVIEMLNTTHVTCEIMMHGKVGFDIGLQFMLCMLGNINIKNTHCMKHMMFKYAKKLAHGFLGLTDVTLNIWSTL